MRNLDQIKVDSVIKILILNFDNLNFHETIKEIEILLNCIKVDNNILIAENFLDVKEVRGEAVVMKEVSFWVIEVKDLEMFKVFDSSNSVYEANFKVWNVSITKHQKVEGILILNSSIVTL